MREKRLDSLLDNFISAGVPGCSLAVSLKGEVIYTGYRGFARVEERKEVDKDTIFLLYSNTKNITTTAVMILYERGLLLLDDPVEKYLPFFKNLSYQTYDGSGEHHIVPVTNRMTIKHLLTMTSGIPGMGKGSLTQAAYNAYPDLNMLPIMEKSRVISQIPLEFDPGTHWRYGIGFDVLGAVVEAISGKTFGQFLMDEIFIPLEMPHTTFLCTRDMQEELAYTYSLQDGTLVRNKRGPNMTEDNGCRCESGSGGLLSTLGDMTNFSSMWAQYGTFKGRRILGKRTIDLIRRNFLNGRPMDDFRRMIRDSYPWYAGYGWGLGVRTMIDPCQSGSNGSIGEFGWCGAAGTYLLADPELGLGVMYMQQMLPVIGGMQDYCHPRIRNAVYALLND